MKVNQFHSGTAFGDAITNQMLLIQKLLVEEGYESNIYAEYIPTELKKKILPIEKYESNEDNILLVHHSMGFDGFDNIVSLKDKKVLIYHNITPECFFEDEHTKKYIRKGLKQAKEYRKYVVYAVAASNYNRKDLVQMGYHNVDVMPVQISLDRFEKCSSDLKIKEELKGTKNILFVGRVVKNKRQDDVVRAFGVYAKYYNSNTKLCIVGDDGNENYVNLLRRIAKEFGVEDKVCIPGKVSEEALKAYYESADVFLCMSEHEGFGVPLLEAMKMGVPVVAYASSAIPETMDRAGILVDEKNYALLGSLLNELIENRELHQKIVQKQYERIKRLNATDTRKILLQILKNVKEQKRPRQIQMQGPFETSYSLAIVNRKLIEHMDDMKQDEISIYCTEGPGDYDPKEEDLKDKPHAKALWEKSKNITYPDITIRNMYPPRVSDANGALNFQSFGWEESKVPPKYIADFNRYLSGVGTTSQFVTDVLKECGLKIPVRTMGNGVELVSNFEELKPYKLNTKKKVKFLHISSAFPRKGVDVLLKAYYKTFSGADDVCLVLKTFPNPHNNVAEILDELNQKYVNPPEVEWINGDLTNEELNRLYKSANCYVQVARGEGFGLPVAEAMLAKIPVIVSPNSGMADFCNEDTAILVDYHLEPAVTHLTVDGSMWAEPSMESLSQKMWIFVEEPESFNIEQKVKNAYELISTEFTWDAVAKRWYQFIEDVEKQQEKPEVAVVTTWNTKCGIAEYSKMKIDEMEKYAKFTIYPNYGDELLKCDEENVAPRLWHSAFQGNLDALVKALRESNCEIVEIQFNFGFFELKQLAKLIVELHEEKKIIIVFHKTEDADVGGKIVSLKSIAREINLCAGLIVHQEKDKKLLIEFGIHESLISILPLGQLVYKDISILDAKKRIGISQKLVIGSYGFLLPHKGIKEVIEAIADIKKVCPDVLYMPVCALHNSPESKKYYEDCEKKIRELGLTNEVRMITDFLPNDESMKYLQACDILIMPYKPSKESASGAVRVCLAAKRPLITTHQDIFAEFEKCSYQIEKTDSNLIKQAILDIYQGRDMSVYMDEMEHYMQECSWETYGEKLNQIYHNICATE